MSMLYTCIRGQMSNTFFQSGGKCPPLSITWGQMSLYTIFHWGADIRGGNVLLSNVDILFMYLISYISYKIFYILYKI